MLFPGILVESMTDADDNRFQLLLIRQTNII